MEGGPHPVDLSFSGGVIMRAPFRLRLIAALIAAAFLLGCDENPISGPGDGADALPDADIIVADSMTRSSSDSARRPI